MLFWLQLPTEVIVILSTLCSRLTMEAETAQTLLLQIQAVLLICLLINRSQLTTIYAPHVYVSHKNSESVESKL